MPCSMLPIPAPRCGNPLSRADIAERPSKRMLAQVWLKLVRGSHADNIGRQMAGKKGRRDWGWIRPSGRRWHASYKGPDAMRHNAPRTFTSKMDAEEWLARERRLTAQGIWTPPAARTAAKRAETLTVTDYTQTWITQRQLKPRTRIGYQSLLDRHIADSFLGPVPLRSLTA